MLPDEIDKQVAAALERHTKDKEVVEVGLAMKAADLLIGWIKIFGLFVAVPATAILAALGWFGIAKFEDVRKKLEQANAILAEARLAAAQADGALQDARGKLATASQSAAAIDSQLLRLDDVVTRNEQTIAQHEQRIEALGNTVSNIAQALKFAPDIGLSNALQNRISESVNEFLEYFKRLGYQPSGAERSEVIVKTDMPNPDQIAYYEPGSSTMFVNPAYADSEYAVLRQYAHHVLLVSTPAGKSGLPDLPEWIGLEYGLADFFPASFLNRSKLEAIPKQPGQGSYVADLENSESLRVIALAQGDFMRIGQAQQAWGGALWEIRGKVGQDIADMCVYRAWRAQPPTAGAGVSRAFVEHLLTLARGLAAQEGERAVRQILLGRGLDPEFLPPQMNAAG